MNTENLIFPNEVEKNDQVFEYNSEVTTHLNTIFGGLLKAVYVFKNPDRYNPTPSFSVDGKELDLNGLVIWMLFINDALVCFSNSEWGSLDN